MYSDLFPQDKLPPFSIANVTAQPANLSSSIVYNFITRGDTDGDYNSFHLDPLTGHVTLAKKLDYETKDEYNVSTDWNWVGMVALGFFGPKSKNVLVNAIKNMHHV